MSSSNSNQINNLISRLNAQNIQIERTQAQFLLDATGGDADLALALYWEDSVVHAARDRDRERHAREDLERSPRLHAGHAANPHAHDVHGDGDGDGDHDGDGDNDRDRGREREREPELEQHDVPPPNPPDLRERRREQKRERSNRSRSRRSARRPIGAPAGPLGLALAGAGAAAALNNEAVNDRDLLPDLGYFRLRRDRDGVGNVDVNANADVDANPNANDNINENANPDDAPLDREGEEMGIGMLGNQDADRARDANHIRRVAAHRVDPDNPHAPVSDDEGGNFNERFLQRIKTHMNQQYRRKNSSESTSGKKKMKLKGVSWADKFDLFLKELDGRQRKVDYDDASSVLEELIKLSNRKKYLDGAEDDGDGKDQDRDGKPPSHGAENVNDDISDEEEDADVDAQYVEALNLLDSSTAMPSKLLWGRIDDRQGSTLSRRASRNDDDDDDSDISDIPPAGELPVPRARDRKSKDGPKGGGGDDDGNDDEDNDNDDDSKEGKNVVEIPRTWLSAGFTLSVCGSGLSLSKPDETEMARLKSMQTELFPPGTSSMAPPLPPFHCGGITMLTSLVTALLYSGASIQGKEVNCNAAKRKPFVELSVDEKRKQFTRRLADALSAILFVAGETSTNFRLQKLAEISKKLDKRHESKRDGHESEEDHDTDHSLKDREATMKRVMETRAMLCPVCRWDESGDNKDLEPLDKDPLKMHVSLTNRRDLRAFVVANLRSFMAPGGCALFLETVMHIHGLPRVQRMLHEARGIECKDNPCSSFITCNCEKKLKDEWEGFLQKRKVDSSIRQKDWTEPLCRDCVAPELLSLLLTGSPHVDMKDWVANKFGIGILSGAIVEDEASVNSFLKSPQRPIWMVEGDTSYFVMWNENKQNDAKALGQDSFSFDVNCWNCWDEEQEKDIYRIVPARNTSMLSPEGSDPIAKTEVEQTRVNPDDKLNYRDFRRWRYAFDNGKGNHPSDQSIPNRWVSFFNLTHRQKEIVQRKYASNIQLAVWSKWPNAQVEEA